MKSTADNFFNEYHYIFLNKFSFFRSRGWFTVNSLDANIDIAYKKVGDGHPLRLWRCITDIGGTPKDVLDYIIKKRASWDVNLLQSQTIKKLDERTEIFQYAFDGQAPTDFCVLRLI